MNGKSFAEFKDPCVGDLVKPNSWFLEVNKNDHSNKEDLLNTLELLSTGGFAIENIYSFNEVSKILVFSFSPSYYNGEQGHQIKLNVLESLVNIEGNLLSCNQIFKPI